MIGWMQNWDTCKTTGYEERPWFGQMSLPRELFLKNGRLYQQPVRELAQYRSGKTTYENVLLDGEKTLEGIEGRVAELDIRVRPADPDNPFRNFVMYFARNEKYHSILSYRPHESWLQIDRKINDGEQVMTATILTGSDARGISFETDGKAVMDITKYALFDGV